MHEDQVSVTLQGTLDALTRETSMRAGVVDFQNGSHGAVQRARSSLISPTLADLAESLINHIRGALERFTEMEGTFKIQALVRRRRVPGIAGYRQSYTGFWGTLTVADHWDAVFGADRNGELIFRRGPWESWSNTLPAIENVDLTLPLILSPYCGTLFHEAVGHALEAEYLDSSPLKFYRGERVAGAELTAVDRPDLMGYAGSMSHDDCGRPASETTLIHRGILVGDLSPGHGAMRRASYRELPLLRATNFVIREGTGRPMPWLSDLPRALYVAWVQNGNWKPGDHRFKVMTGPIFLLEHGQPVAYLPWTTLELHTLAFLKAIRELGDDLTMDPVVHWCVKKNQAVPMSLGSPSMLVEGYQP
jgi:hypothetical protein